MDPLQKERLADLTSRLEQLSKLLDLDEMKKEVQEIEVQMHNPSFWNDPRSQTKISRLKGLKKVLEAFVIARNQSTDLKELGEIATNQEMEQELQRLQGWVEELEISHLLGEEHDARAAIFSIHAGAGGTESCDWVSMLYRMYSRWAQQRGLTLQEIDFLPGEETGIKSVSAIIRGNYAYGYLKSERGVHRLVRISPFDANKRRHTSFASVDVIPEIPDDIVIEVEEEDLRIDTYRSSGKGGQHVNMTDSAVRITHLPTGFVVQCQNERSQHQNKAVAMKVLRARLYEREHQAREAEMIKLQGNKQKIEWGSQIRSYVLHPYSMVKDHRTQKETSNAQAVLDGAIDLFVEAYLRWRLK